MSLPARASSAARVGPVAPAVPAQCKVPRAVLPEEWSLASDWLHCPIMGSLPFLSSGYLQKTKNVIKKNLIES